MLRLKGETRVEYFHVLCEDDGEHVELSDLRWEGVPVVHAKCPKCGKSDDFKLVVSGWVRAMPEAR